MENGFQGKNEQVVPEMNADFVSAVSKRYIELYESIIGEPFVKSDSSEITNRVKGNVIAFLANRQ